MVEIVRASAIIVNIVEINHANVHVAEDVIYAEILGVMGDIRVGAIVDITKEDTDHAIVIDVHAHLQILTESIQSIDII